MIVIYYPICYCIYKFLFHVLSIVGIVSIVALHNTDKMASSSSNDWNCVNDVLMKEANDQYEYDLLIVKEVNKCFNGSHEGFLTHEHVNQA